MTGDPIPHATMVLERRTPGSQVVEAGAGRRRQATAACGPPCRRDERAFYRWRFVERPLAEGNASMALLLDLLPTLPTDPPSTPCQLPPSDAVRLRVTLGPGVDRPVRDPAVTGSAGQ